MILAPLPNGNVMTAGGATFNDAPIAEAEVFNVQTHQWATVGSMASPRKTHQVLDRCTVMLGPCSIMVWQLVDSVTALLLPFFSMGCKRGHA